MRFSLSGSTMTLIGAGPCGLCGPRSTQIFDRVGRPCIWPTGNYQLVELETRVVALESVSCMRLNIQFVSMALLFVWAFCNS